MHVLHACTMIIVHASTMIIVHACTLIIVHACTMIIVQACIMIIAHSCTMNIVHACTMIIVHACTMIIVHANTFYSREGIGVWSYCSSEGSEGGELPDNSQVFIWLGGVRSDPPLPNKKPVFYLREGGWPVEPTQVGEGLTPPQRYNPFSQTWFDNGTGSAV